MPGDFNMRLLVRARHRDALLAGLPGWPAPSHRSDDLSQLQAVCAAPRLDFHLRATNLSTATQLSRALTSLSMEADWTCTHGQTGRIAPLVKGCRAVMHFSSLSAA